MPGSLRGVALSPPSRCSITSIAESKPLHSWKPACVMPVISTRKLKFAYGSTRFAVAMAVSSGLDGLRLAVEQGDAHDDELGGPDRRDAHLDEQLAERACTWRIDGFVDPHVEGLVGG